jgi:hypothetical protein
MKSGPGGDRFHLIHWSYVGAGVPWQHTGCWHWKQPAEPAPTEPDHTKPDRITARQVVQIAPTNTGRVAALCNDGTIWVSDATQSWMQLEPIPQP